MLISFVVCKTQIAPAFFFNKPTGFFLHVFGGIWSLDLNPNSISTLLDIFLGHDLNFKFWSLLLQMEYIDIYCFHYCIASQLKYVAESK